ncbi:MAG: type III secretion system chaperone [Mailhella sp.]|nr:type III secretion system chaperone [Mailhella sp.]
MNAEQLIRELGNALGIDLELGVSRTCRVALDGDVVDFEASGESLWVMADLGPAQGREHVGTSLLAANSLGRQSGGATLALDEERGMFTMHMELWADMPYAVFEKRLAVFIKALRWWKAWLALPPVAGADACTSDASPLSLPAGALRI